MQQPDGTIQPIPDFAADVLRNIAKAGGRELPIFKRGEEVAVSGGRFRVLAWGGSLLVLEGVPTDAPRVVPPDDFEAVRERLREAQRERAEAER